MRTIEIIGTSITTDHVVQLICQDVSDEHLQYLERVRDDLPQEDIVYEYDTSDPKQFWALRSWLKKQKATQKPDIKTWGQALNAVIGTVVEAPRWRRTWDR